ncbi:hypothetical protein BDR07DRAFT_1478730 [Suillus spraguei]|nr:hypothetical protein BDR07DRAFT_1478730 [Suillus spraguei]
MRASPTLPRRSCPSTAGVVDTGTTFILIATDVFAKYQSATGAAWDDVTGLLTVSSAKYEALNNLDFHIGKVRHFCQPPYRYNVVHDEIYVIASTTNFGVERTRPDLGVRNESEGFLCKMVNKGYQGR